MNISRLPIHNESNLIFYIQVDLHNRDDIVFADGYPCTVSEVRIGMITPSNRPMPGDVLVQVNEINVSRTQAKAVNKLIRFDNLLK